MIRVGVTQKRIGLVDVRRTVVVVMMSGSLPVQCLMFRLCSEIRRRRSCNADGLAQQAEHQKRV